MVIYELQNPNSLPTAIVNISSFEDVTRAFYVQMKQRLIEWYNDTLFPEWENFWLYIQCVITAKIFRWYKHTIFDEELVDLIFIYSSKDLPADIYENLANATFVNRHILYTQEFGPGGWPACYFRDGKTEESPYSQQEVPVGDNEGLCLYYRKLFERCVRLDVVTMVHSLEIPGYGSF